MAARAVKSYLWGFSTEVFVSVSMRPHEGQDRSNSRNIELGDVRSIVNIRMALESHLRI